jgi:putative ABC transport system permease protein
MIIRNSLRQHALSTAITAASIGLGGGLLMAVWVVNFQTQREFKNVTGGFDAILGPRGSPTQLVLNSLFHMDSSPGLISAADYKMFRTKYQRFYKNAVPIAVGDNYEGFRIVGTTHDLFAAEHSPGKRYEISVGEYFIQNDKEWAQEAVIGDFAARKLGLRLNTKFNPYHGLNFAPGQKPHKDEYTVVGILKPTGTPADRVIWIPIEGLQQMDGHDPRYAGDVSAVLIQMSDNPTAHSFNANSLDNIYNKGTDHLTFVKSTNDVVVRLFERFGWAEKVLRWVAYLVSVVAAGSVLASIYNSMNERRREFAILRALGARRGTVFSVIVLESAAISAFGAALGFAVYAGIMTAAESILRNEIGVTLRPFEWHEVMAYVPFGLIVLGAVVGIVPALKAYSTDVAENLIPQS